MAKCQWGWNDYTFTTAPWPEAVNSKPNISCTPAHLPQHCHGIFTCLSALFRSLARGRWLLPAQATQCGKDHCQQDRKRYRIASQILQEPVVELVGKWHLHDRPSLRQETFSSQTSTTLHYRQDVTRTWSEDKCKGSNACRHPSQCSPPAARHSGIDPPSSACPSPILVPRPGLNPYRPGLKPYRDYSKAQCRKQVSQSTTDTDAIPTQTFVVASKSDTKAKLKWVRMAPGRRQRV